MVSLISRWKLKNGCPPELATALRDVAAAVEAAEQRTLVYSVHLDALSPLGPGAKLLDPLPEPIPDFQQTEVVFFEVYADAQAFHDHVNGPTFTAFREANMKYFYEDPTNPGWPNTDNIMLDRQSAYFRPDAN